MKKILSLLLIFMLSLTVVGLRGNVKAEATQDVTIYLHIHQFDWDYTNTGTGVWDGVNWNDFGDVATTTDGFGAVVQLDYTAAELNALADSIEFKPTRDVNNDDNVLEGGLAGNSNYLAPDSVEGKVFADITALKADDAFTEMHLYYVEGALDFYVVEGPVVNGMFFNVYANPEVAADETAYDGWGMHTWNNGLPDITYFDNPNKYEIEMELESSVGWIPARLGMIEVAAGNVGDAGFIAHWGENEAEELKSCYDDMSFDTDELLALDGQAQVVYYQHGLCEFTPSYSDFLTAVATQFEINSGNRIVEGTAVTTPSTMDVTMLMERQPQELTTDLFTILDGAGVEIPILDISFPVHAFGSYESDVELRTETHVVVFVDTAVDINDVALVGNIQGWAPDGDVITAIGTDINGYDVFEFTTFETQAEFKFLVDEDANGFNWGDTELIGSNIVVDLSAGGTIEVFFDDATDTYNVSDGAAQDVDIANYTYTSGVTCAAGQNLFTLFLDTELDPASIGLVGSIQEANNWSPENAIMSTGETAEGYVVFEVCLDGTNVEYKVLFNDAVDDPATTDVDESVFAWGNRELVQSNVVVDFGDGTTDGELAHLITGPITVLGDYEPTLSATSIYRLSIYMSGGEDIDWTKVGIVGSLQENAWTPAEAITYKEVDMFGNAIFDIALSGKTAEYLVLYDADDDGFDWDDKISGDDNITVDLGENATFVQYGMILEDMTMTFEDIGADVESIMTTTVTLHVAEDTFAFDGAYDVHFLENPALPTEVFISEYLEGSSDNKVLELFNPTDMDIDLTGYVLEAYNNGEDTTPTNTLDLTGETILAGGTLVIYNPSAVQAILDVGDVSSTVTYFNGDDAILLKKDGTVIDVFGILGEDPGSEWVVGDGATANYTLRRVGTVTEGVTTFDPTEWEVFASDTFDGLGAHELSVDPIEMVLMLEDVPVALSNNFVAADVVAERGTYAIDPYHIQVEFENTNLLDVVVKLANGTEINIEDEYNMFSAGMYAATYSCETGFTKVYIHLNVRNTDVDDLTKLGAVGTINEWTIEEAIPASGMDTNGNYVFEFCLPEDTTTGEFKIVYDMDGDGWAWNGETDPELTPGNVAFDLANGNRLFVLEGQSSLDTVDTIVIELTATTRLRKDSTYYLEATDENGFVITMPLVMDTEAPVVQYTRIPDVELVFNNDQPLSEFDLMDYFSILTFVDTRDGDLGYTIETTLDLSTAGEQTVTISAVDAWDNKATHDITITVVNIDNEAPTFTGNSELTLTVGDTEPDWASLVTISDGTLSVNESQVDLTSAGNFFVIYTATDDAGNTSTFNLEVTVEAEDIPDEVIEDTGCFGSLNIANTLITVVMVALGGAVILVVRKR